jgi:hypothetical protein
MSEEHPPPTYFGAPPRVPGRSAGGRVKMFAGFAARTARAWLSALQRVVQLRLERRRLERKRRQLQYELGGVALAQDDTLVAVVRDQLRACIEELRRNEHDTRIAVDRARDLTSEERSAVAATEIRLPDAGSMGDPGFEPGTSALSERRSNQLS